MRSFADIWQYLAEFFLEWETFDKSCGQNQTTHITVNKIFPKIKPFNVEKYGRIRLPPDGNITRRMRFACWITNARNTNSEYIMPIAFPRQQWLREHASMLRLYVNYLSSWNVPNSYRRSSHAQLVNSGRKVRFLGDNLERTEMTEEIDIQWKHLLISCTPSCLHLVERSPPPAHKPR